MALKSDETRIEEQITLVRVTKFCILELKILKKTILNSNFDFALYEEVAWLKMQTPTGNNHPRKT